MQYIVILVYMYIVISVIRNVLSKKPSDKNASKPRQYNVPRQQNSVRNTIVESLRNQQVIHVPSESERKKKVETDVCAMEDRKNDFLARQIREERQSKINMDDMFQLKKSHADHCDANYVRMIHQTNCDAEALKSQYR